MPPPTLYQLLFHPTLPPAAHDGMLAALGARHHGRGLATLVARLASHPAATAAQRARWAADRRAGVRAAAAAATDDPALLEALADTTAAPVQAAVAANRACPPDLLARLAGSRDTAVRLGALANPACPPATVATAARRLSDNALQATIPWTHRMDRTVAWAALSVHTPLLERMASLADSSARRVAAACYPRVADHPTAGPALRNHPANSPVQMNVATSAAAAGLPVPAAVGRNAHDAAAAVTAWLDGRDLQAACTDPASRPAGRSLSADMVDRMLAATVTDAAAAGDTSVPAVALADLKAMTGAHTEPDVIGTVAQAALTADPTCHEHVEAPIEQIGSDRRRAVRRVATALRWRYHPGAQRLVDELGDDADAWTHAVVLLEDWQAGTRELAESARALAA